MFGEGTAATWRFMNCLIVCAGAKSGVSAIGASLNPFGSTLLQNAAFGSLPGANVPPSRKLEFTIFNN
jgi:hypothetical protein